MHFFEAADAITIQTCDPVALLSLGPGSRFRHSAMTVRADLLKVHESVVRVHVDPIKALGWFLASLYSIVSVVMNLSLIHI